MLDRVRQAEPANAVAHLPTRIFVSEEEEASTSSSSETSQAAAISQAAASTQTTASTTCSTSWASCGTCPYAASASFRITPGRSGTTCCAASSCSTGTSTSVAPGCSAAICGASGCSASTHAAPGRSAATYGVLEPRGSASCRSGASTCARGTFPEDPASANSPLSCWNAPLPASTCEWNRGDTGNRDKGWGWDLHAGRQHNHNNWWCAGALPGLIAPTTTSRAFPIGHTTACW